MKNILITREKSQFEEVKKLFEKEGFNPISFPTIKFEEVENNINVNEYDYLIFTSKNAVTFFLKKFPNINNKKILTVGEKTAQALENYGFKDIIFPENYSGEGLLDFLKRNKDEFINKKIGLVRALEGNDTLLNQKEFKVDLIPVYKTVFNIPENVDTIEDMFRNSLIYAVIFSSPSTFEGFLRIFKDDTKNLLSKTKVVAIGKTTEKFIISKGFSIDFIPKKYTFEEIVKNLKTLNNT